jgi:two-component system sensor histidine kinase BaeS
MRLGGANLRPEVRERAIESILVQTQTLARMIADIIDLTGIQSAGMLAMHPELIDLDSLVSETIEDWRLEMAAAGIIPHFAPGHRPALIEADPVRLRKALDALMHNACRYSPHGGSLTITLSQADGEATLALADTGAGISDKDLPYIFDRFYRGEPVDRHGAPIDVRGAGQGLYTARTIVEAHGGTIGVESRVGRGSVFTIHLPLAGKRGSQT